MAEWRFRRGWTERELSQRLEQLRYARSGAGPTEELRQERGWNRTSSASFLARETPGS